VSFELEGLEWGPDRVRVVGRWFGVRGRRFIRPVLEVDVGDERRRLLAVLDHKPWPAEDGEEWLAAFPWEGDAQQPSGAELSVAPGITVELIGSPPRAKGNGRRPAPTRRPAGPSSDDLERALAAARAELERVQAELESTRGAHLAEVADLRGRLAAERQTAKRVTEELEEVRARGAAEREEGERRLDRLERERDEAVRSAEHATRTRDEVTRARDDARGDRDLLARERDAAVRVGERAQAERDQWMSRARTLAAELDEVRKELDAERAERARSPWPAGPARLDIGPPASGPLLRVWIPRLVALLALVVLVAVVAGLVSWAI
jgi:hypothetical protein